MLEKTLESPLDYKEIKPVHPKGQQGPHLPGILTAELSLVTRKLTNGKKIAVAMG